MLPEHLQDSQHIPLELMQILHEISRGVNEVKERIARIEGQDHTDSIKSLRRDLDKEREARIRLELEVNSVRTRLAPILVGIALFAPVIVDLIVKRFTF